MDMTKNKQRLTHLSNIQCSLIAYCSLLGHLLKNEETAMDTMREEKRLTHSLIKHSMLTYCLMPTPWSSVKQGRIHGHQLRTGGQGSKCAFSHFSTRA